MKKLYFGHPKGTYDTKYEIATLDRIRRSFLCENDPTVVNPNNPRHETGAARYRITAGTESSMGYWLALVRSCDAGVFLLMPDGMWSYGTALEAKELLQKGAPVWTIAFDGTLVRVADIPPTRCLSREETTKANEGIRVMATWKGH